ncbi:hypothetical protein MWMV2_MWMV2_03657 [Acinetobacter oleivorans]|uniref:ATP-grasp domain-containing protein n=1 Tax=Acinetobacter oleivorans TaxID=1148157 RepID=UPI0017863BE8|nr:ATP-grasp domain-containing protein [Acinetobacter oleivorans]CAI3119551.1 hypothetical protein MWMV5_MWMV5_03658 [Acinetobacter oleivorans]CAI3119571.1 hypothetical protein MWMV13_MWMV13_03659 [Acinetobacter oleivorans]CAI3119650.1 hypothetical protein MWMV2_MWMV2_03657 [Acinetobacter oleivorans]CAI3120108.1 hypothetical protein MWMV12_MWMV12_03689 [Acinetobacter oleivorans]CAI3120115.1 hypothetical protein MWMV3_MWMV3_03727 [Acinetobacter oleivorans]
MKKAILLGHQGYGGVTRNAKEIRECGFEPFIITSKPIYPVEKFTEAMNSLGLSFRIVEQLTLTLDETINILPEPIENYVFCLSVWEGQRLLVSQINEILGAKDISPALVSLIQNKYRLRNKLYELGLTKYRAFSYHDLLLEPSISDEVPLFVKPVNSTGSLCSKRVEGKSAVLSLMKDAITFHDDFFFSEFYQDIELFAEPYICGKEFSFELVVDNGEVKFCTAHEKLRVDELENTVLEVSFCSPPITIDPSILRLGEEKVAIYFSALGISDGCYHVELRYNDIDKWELIEINPRTGGALVYDSVIERHGVKMVSQWILSLTRQTLTVSDKEYNKGTYFQIAYANAGEQILNIEINNRYLEPDISQKILNVGDVTPISDREVFGAFNMWLTCIDKHVEQVADMDSALYMSYISRDISSS